MKYLTKEQVIYLHKQLTQKFGGMEGIRNEGLLESAIVSPFQTFSLKERRKSCASWIRTSFQSLLY